VASYPDIGTRVAIAYSTPIQNKAELLDGTLNTEVLGYRNVALVIIRHVFKPYIQEKIADLVPPGYFLTGHISITPDPPKLRMYQMSATSECFSKTPLNFVIHRFDDNPSFKG